MKSNYKRLGDYIQEIDRRNIKGELSTLLGINIDKYYMPSVANIVGTDLTAYKIVKRNQFACNRMHVGRDKRLPVALSKTNEGFIVSPAYDVFEITNENSLLPEYLMMWFSRKEFDRNAWFYTDADVRGGLSWKDFCNMQLPVPHPDKQREITKEYNTIVDRININNQLINKLEETAQSIYKQWFVYFEFPNEEGKPYKFSGGEMVKSVLGEIPKGWGDQKMEELAKLKYGKMLDASLFFEKGYPVFSGYGIRGYFSEYMYAEPQILILCRGVSGTGEVKLSPSFSWITNLSIIVEVDENVIRKMYLYYYLKNRNLRSLDSGSAQSQITTGDLYNEYILLPSIKTQTKFHDLFCKINSQKELLTSEISLLIKLESLLLAKLSTIEN
jgi:type I restriction enzyme S subunit